MTSRDFCYWLQGYFELQGSTQTMTTDQVETVKNHLNMVFLHEIDPSMGDEKHQKVLNEAHQKTDAKEDRIPTHVPYDPHRKIMC